jgi:hypothetical protein
MKNGDYNLIIAPIDYPGKRYRGRYAYEHIVEFWKTTGRLPIPGHIIHHDNENKRDNVFCNLKEIQNGVHTSMHHLPSTAEHGTATRYRRGCRCIDCRVAKTESQKRWRNRKRTA